MSDSDGSERSGMPADAERSAPDALRPAVRRRDEGDDRAIGHPPPALEPEPIDLENAVFVLLGVVLVVGFLLAALQGL